MHKIIEAEIRRLQHQIKQIGALELIVQDAQSVIEGTEGQISISIFASVTITLIIDHIKEIEPFMLRLSKLGYVNKTRNDFEALSSLTWPYIKEEKEISLTGILHGNQCKFVQVGTKDIPIYELKCD